MKLHFITLALDAQPYIAHHINQFNQLPFDWDWSITEGVAKPFKDTGWCKDIPARLSNDGTHNYLRELSSYHPKVAFHWRDEWPGKTAMLNYALQFLKGDGLLMQIDADELWTTEQLVKIYQMFKHSPRFQWAEFYCRYLLGANVEAITPGCYGNNPGEWKRVWRWREGQMFDRHEPPILEDINYQTMPGFDRDCTKQFGLVFWHPAYALEKTLAFKGAYYGYTDALAQWKRLQKDAADPAVKFPRPVSEYLKWVTDGAMCDRVVNI